MRTFFTAISCFWMGYVLVKVFMLILLNRNFIISNISMQIFSDMYLYREVSVAECIYRKLFLSMVLDLCLMLLGAHCDNILSRYINYKWGPFCFHT